MSARLIVAALALAVAAAPAMAANARNPYGNVDRRVDAGNDTGDNQVDRLNEMQLNRNYYRGAPPPQPMPMPGYGPQQGYPYPAPYPYPYAPPAPGYYGR